MKNISTANIPQPVVDKAIKIYSDQSFWPLSPGVSKSGQVSYCAAAALAAAGLEVKGRSEELNQFNIDVATSKSSDCIRQVFLNLGWSVELCNRTIIRNDELLSNARRSGVLKVLSSIRIGHKRDSTAS